MTATEKYCYKTESCDGFLLDSFTYVLTRDQCCKVQGQGWGLFGSNDCSPCVPLPFDDMKDRQDLEKKLDVPSGMFIT